MFDPDLQCDLGSPTQLRTWSFELEHPAMTLRVDPDGYELLARGSETPLSGSDLRGLSRFFLRAAGLIEAFSVAP